MCKVVNLRNQKADIIIDRRSKYGNPFILGKDGNRETVIKLYRTWLWKAIQDNRITTQELAAMSGKTLGCWCKPKACHGDIICDAVKWACEELNRRLDTQE